MEKDKKQEPFIPFDPALFMSPEDQSNREMIRKMAEKDQQKPNTTPSVTQRWYFKPADFGNLQDKYKEMDKWNNALVKLLRITPQSQNEGHKIQRLYEQAFSNLQGALHNFITLWTQSTAGFLGTKEDVREVYRLLINEAKSILTIGNPPKRVQLEIVVISMKHTLGWLISQAFPYSVGDTSKAIHPQLAKLEETQLRAVGGMMALGESRAGFLTKVRKKLPFARGKTHYDQSEMLGTQSPPELGKGVE